MPVVKNNALAGAPLITGGVLTAPVGTALPPDAATALNASFLAVGYLSTDGFAADPKRDSDTVNAWGGDTILLTQKGYGVEVTFTMIEALGAQALKVAFGSVNVTTTAPTGTTDTLQAVKWNAVQLDHWSLIAEIRYQARKLRLVLPDFQVNDLDKIEYKDSDAIGYAVTGQAFPDASGNYVYHYSDDGVHI